LGPTPADGETNTGRPEDQGKGPSLGARAARGSLWTIAGFGGAQVLRFAGNIILTRLLFREAFGLMALVNVFLMGLALFSDIGVGPSIIQNKRGDEPSFLNTAWTIQVGRGIALWLVACAGAVPFAYFYGEPLLGAVLPVSGLAALLMGLNSTKLFTMNRHLAMGRLALVDLSSQAIGLVIMVVLAYFYRSVWSLVAGGLVQAALKMVFSHIFLPGARNRFHWSRADARSLFSFGQWIFVSTALMFLATQSDRLIFGRMVPLGMLGVYQIGLTLAFIPLQVLERLANSIVFALYARVHSSGGDLAVAFRRVRWPIVVAGGWMLSGLMAGGVAIISFFYDERYADAGWIVQLLSIGSWVRVVAATYSALVLARGQAKWVAASNFGKLLGMFVLVPLGYWQGGFPGAVLALAVAELARVIVVIVPAARARIQGWKQDLSLSLLVAVAAIAGRSADAFLGAADASLILRMAVVFVIVTALWAPLGIVAIRRARRKESRLA
jgi:O-antigen/teichoic acid export membrane protein